MAAFDNANDPFQMNNLIKNKAAGTKDDLEQLLRTKMRELNDTFESSDQIIAKHQLQQHVAKTGLGPQKPGLTHGLRAMKTNQRRGRSSNS